MWASADFLGFQPRTFDKSKGVEQRLRGKSLQDFALIFTS